MFDSVTLPDIFHNIPGAEYGVPPGQLSCFGTMQAPQIIEGIPFQTQIFIHIMKQWLILIQFYEFHFAKYQLYPVRVKQGGCALQRMQFRPLNVELEDINTMDTIFIAKIYQ
jgi:hypothetical protein